MINTIVQACGAAIKALCHCGRLLPLERQSFTPRSGAFAPCPNCSQAPGRRPPPLAARPLQTEPGDFSGNRPSAATAPAGRGVGGRTCLAGGLAKARPAPAAPGPAAERAPPSRVQRAGLPQGPTGVRCPGAGQGGASLSLAFDSCPSHSHAAKPLLRKCPNEATARMGTTEEVTSHIHLRFVLNSRNSNSLRMPSSSPHF